VDVARTRSAFGQRITVQEERQIALEIEEARKAFEASRTITLTQGAFSSRAHRARTLLMMLYWQLASSAAYVARAEARRLGRQCRLDVEDLYQEGILGLYKAAMKFDPQHGVRFPTYARWWVRAYITLSIDMTERMIRLPRSVVYKSRDVLKIRKDLQDLGIPFTASDVAARAGITLEQLVRLEEWFERPLYLEVSEDREKKLDHPLEDVFTPSLEEALIDRIQFEQIKEALGSLSGRSSHVLTRMFGLDGEDAETNVEIGRRLGLSRERIRQIAATAMDGIRHRL
jgi:RNA polymerase sigma factor (sigma-70 family)